MARPGPNTILGIAVAVFAVAVIFVWVPLDTDTGLIEKVRRRVTIGDALAPTVAAGFCLLGAALLLVFERRAPDQTGLNGGNLRFMAQLLLLFVVTLAVMRWVGVAVTALLESEQSYRALRDTAPWKYIGYVAGGSLLIVGMIAWVEARLRPRTVLIGLLAALALALLYDLPFDDLLLPPNGDV